MQGFIYTKEKFFKCYYILLAQNFHFFITKNDKKQNVSNI